MKADSRVHYQITTKIATNTKNGVMIIDESDEIMFKDLDVFYANTNYKNLKKICLTATAYDGTEEGIELKTLTALQYKIYYN